MTDLIGRWQEYLDRAVINDSMRTLVQGTIDEIERLRGDLGIAKLQRDAKLSSQTAVDEAQAREIERLNKQHDDFLQEFWKTNAENAKLQAVVDAAKVVVRDLDLMNLPASCPNLREALAALEGDDDLL